jgi:chromosome segregation ATPase
MKRMMYSLSVALVAGLIYTGCNASTEQEDENESAVESVRQDLENVKDDTRQNSADIANAEEWKAYKANSQAVIDNYETRIAQLNEEVKRSGKTIDAAYEQRIQALEQRNRDLKTKMEAYEVNQTDWEMFKAEYDRNIDELGQALKEFTIIKK